MNQQQNSNIFMDDTSATLDDVRKRAGEWQSGCRERVRQGRAAEWRTSAHTKYRVLWSVNIRWFSPFGFSFIKRGKKRRAPPQLQRELLVVPRIPTTAPQHHDYTHRKGPHIFMGSCIGICLLELLFAWEWQRSHSSSSERDSRECGKWSWLGFEAVLMRTDEKFSHAFLLRSAKRHTRTLTQPPAHRWWDGIFPISSLQFAFCNHFVFDQTKCHIFCPVFGHCSAHFIWPGVKLAFWALSVRACWHLFSLFHIHSAYILARNW